jgi:hypothetical protein
MTSYNLKLIQFQIIDECEERIILIQIEPTAVSVFPSVKFCGVMNDGIGNIIEK